MTATSRPDRWRWRYLTYGPIADADRDDQWDIAWAIQRGQAVTEDRLVPQALAYARFRSRVYLTLALIYLTLVGYLAFRASSGYWIAIACALGAAAMLGASGMFFWLADRCRQGAKATVQAHRAGAAR
jgi:hypothetical protein